MENRNVARVADRQRIRAPLPLKNSSVPDRIFFNMMMSVVVNVAGPPFTWTWVDDKTKKTYSQTQYTPISVAPLSHQTTPGDCEESTPCMTGPYVLISQGGAQVSYLNTSPALALTNGPGTFNTIANYTQGNEWKYIMPCAATFVNNTVDSFMYLPAFDVWVAPGDIQTVWRPYADGNTNIVCNTTDGPAIQVVKSSDTVSWSVFRPIAQIGCSGSDVRADQGQRVYLGGDGTAYQFFFQNTVQRFSLACNTATAPGNGSFCIPGTAQATCTACIDALPSLYVLQGIVGSNTSDEQWLFASGTATVAVTVLNYLSGPAQVTVTTIKGGVPVPETQVIWPSFANGVPGTPKPSTAPTVAYVFQNVPVGSSLVVQPVRVRVCETGSGAAFGGSSCASGDSLGSSFPPWWTPDGSDGVSASVPSGAALVPVGPPTTVVVGTYPKQRPQPTKNEGVASDAATLHNVWYFDTAPTPAVTYATNRAYFAAATTWGDLGSDGVTIAPAVSNVVLRAAPLLRVYANNANAWNTTTPAAVAPANVYLGSAPVGQAPGTSSPWRAQVTAGGAQALLTPLLPNDVLVCELPSQSQASKDGKGFSCGNLSDLDSQYVMSTLTLGALQAGRPAQPPTTPYNWLPTPVRLTPFITLVADNGAEVTLAIGDYMPMSVLGLPNQTPTTLTYSDFSRGHADSYDRPWGLQNSVLVPGLLPVTTTCPGDDQFVSTVCAAPGFSRCKPILGITQPTCLGAFSLLETSIGPIADRCSLLCSTPQNPVVNAACRQIQTDNCTVGSGPGESSAAMDAKPECACYRLETSTVKATMVAGQPMTYGSTLSWFAENFGGGGVPAFFNGLPSAYPACNGRDAALVAYSPGPEVQECLALVKNVTIENNSDVSIDLVNKCSLTRSTTATNNTKPTPGTTPPPPPLPASKYIPGVVGTAVGTFFLLVVICFVGVWQLRVIGRSIAPKNSLGGLRNNGAGFGKTFRRGYHV
jgi:hypothetical protein